MTGPVEQKAWRFGGWVWTLCLVPAVAAAASVVFESRKQEPRPVPTAATAVATTESAPRVVAKPPPMLSVAVPKPRPSPKADSRREPARIEPATQLPQSDFAVLTGRWTKEAPDAEWTHEFESDVIKALTAATLEPSILRGTDCRQTLCRFVVDANDAAGLLLQSELSAHHLRLSYVRENLGDDSQIVAIADRSVSAADDN